jgi:hypothetical protein
MKIKRFLVYLWTFPTTLVGLLVTLLTLLTGGHARWHTGVLEVYGGFASFVLRRLVPLPGGATAMTLGHVVIARDPAAHTDTRDHERIHVRQCERWGALFIPAYLIMCLVMKLRGKRGYRDNPFEREAYDNS